VLNFTSGVSLCAWLDKNDAFKGLSMCEAVLIHPKFKRAREYVGEADVFWSHVQCESVKSTFRHMIHIRGDHYTRFFGDWPEDIVWLDMFSLRQRAWDDFNVDATLELIRDIGVVDATANDGYFTRSFCLLEAYGAVRGDAALNVYYVDENVEVDSKSAGATRDADRVRVANFITEEETFGGGEGAFAQFDAYLSEMVKESAEKMQKKYTHWGTQVLQDY